MKKIKIVCSKCGSDDVRCDATAEWDIEKQQWVLCAVLDQGYCEGICQGETTLKEIQVVD